MSDVFSAPGRSRFSLFGRNWRLFVYLAIASVLPLLLFLYAGHRLLRKMSINNLLGQSQEAANIAGKTIEDSLNDSRASVEFLATDPNVVGLWTRGDILHLAGRLREAHDLEPQVASWGIYDSKGVLRVAYPQPDIPDEKSYSSADWFSAALSTGKTQVRTGPSPAGKDIGFAITIAAPLACGSCGVLTATYSPQAVKNLLTPMQIGATEWISVVDSRGIVLVAPGRDPSAYLRDISGHESVRQAIQGKSGTEFVWQDGQQVLVSRHPLSSVGWAVLVEIPLDALNQELWKYERPLGLLGLFFDALALAIGTVIALLYRRLKESREHVQHILTASQDAFVSSDDSGRITEWNPQAEVYFGYSAMEALGQPVSTMVSLPAYSEAPARLPKGVPKKGNVLDSGKRMELTALHRSGRVFPVELSVSHVTGASKNSFNAFIRDISDRQEKFRQSEERFEKVFRSSPLAITIATEDDGLYVDVNDAFLKLVGYRREELLGKTALSLSIWVDPTHRDKMLRQLGNGRASEPLETRFRTKSGEERQVLVSAERIVLDKIPCILANTLDVTDSRRLEAQFLQAQKMEAVGRLAGGVAHDFNNLLGVIMGYCELATDLAPADSPIHRHLEGIKEAGQRAAALTKQLLSFSRKQVATPQILNLNAVVQTTSKMLARLIREDVQLVLKLAESLGSVRANFGQIEQILMNLVVNARDAMPRGGKIVIETANVELDDTYVERHSPVVPGSYVLLSVSDTGHGMDTNIMPRIFEPFFTTKEAGKGTGLGLSTVYGIVRQSGGYVWVYSELNRGTTFKVYLPRVDAAPESLKPEQTRVAFDHGTETILLVEDDPLLRQLTTELLTSAGYTVLEAADANAALAIVENRSAPIHLVLTDVIMPGMSAAELIAQLRSMRPSLAVVFMSGYAGDLVARAGVAEPENLVIQKPFTRKGLLTKVRAVIDEMAHG